jgi:SSS family solute:Na+ symporter
MENNLIIILIVVLYLGLTSFLGFLQSKKIKQAKDFAIVKLTPLQAATFLAGFTLGGIATYGVAGDTVKFGLTYLVWFPISIAMGWWVTGLFFAKPYYRLKGVTLPKLLGDRFNERARLAASFSMMIYTVFVIIIELYTLAMVIRAFAPGLTMLQATAISLVASVGTVAFSGIMGASITNMIHSAMMVGSFALVFAVLWRTVGGWNVAIEKVLLILPEVTEPGITEGIWLSPVGLGLGTIIQILLSKSGRLGGISAVSNLAASCRSEKDAVKAFWWAGLISAIPPVLACGVGVFTAAYLGPMIMEMPLYSAIGYAVSQLHPVLGGIFLAAISAAILSTFSPLAVAFSTVFVEDLVKRTRELTDKQEKLLYPLSIAIISVLSCIYVVYGGIKHIMPFVFSTAFPCTIPNTIVALFGIYVKKTTSQGAFWAITLGVGVSLFWGLVLNDPFNIPNIFVALIVPLLILGIDYAREKQVGRKALLSETS